MKSHDCSVVTIYQQFCSWQLMFEKLVKLSDSVFRLILKLVLTKMWFKIELTCKTIVTSKTYLNRI